ncbi:carbonic anhydrase [Microlunatus elymi]|uniref:carbonic anhydrase n=1 Tax=Microlunatus elymi TaxID=2596828 RepID=A0A516Q621_9ACTN|nr:carbonic anhydrase [Microlunatus elymi]
MDHLVEANRDYAGQYEPGLAGAPSRHVAIVTCMDCRIDPVQALGVHLGDANVIRDAGGLVTEDTIRSLAISQHKLGTTAVMIIQHTKCGLTTFSDVEFRAELQAATGVEPPWQPEPFGASEENIKAALERIRTSPFLPHREDVRGFVFDVDTGLLHEVTA